MLKGSEIVLAAEAVAGTAKAELGKMPEWDLSDLYSGPDAPEVKRDLDAAAAEAKRMKAAYQGKLSDLAKDGGKLLVAIKDYEKLSDLMGKLGSYAGLY